MEAFTHEITIIVNANFLPIETKYTIAKRTNNDNTPPSISQRCTRKCTRDLVDDNNEIANIFNEAAKYVKA